jgi:hypothetical protein
MQDLSVGEIMSAREMVEHGRDDPACPTGGRRDNSATGGILLAHARA